MIVAIVLIITLVIFWVFGSRDFAINMTALYGCFTLVEIINKYATGSTITSKFRDWASGADKWKVWVVAGVFTWLGVFLTWHLIK